jgi:hypothetical protein
VRTPASDPQDGRLDAGLARPLNAPLWPPDADQDNVGHDFGLYGDQLPPPLVPKVNDTYLQSVPVAGMEVVHDGECLVALTRVQRPLHLIGLGIMDFNLLGHVLRL